MADREFAEDDIVLVDVPTFGPQSCQVLEVWPPTATVQSERLWLSVLGTLHRISIDTQQVIGPCDKRSTCMRDDDTCEHCHEGSNDPHKPGCPHQFDLDDETAELELNYRTSDDEPVFVGQIVFTRDGRWGEVTEVAVDLADVGKADAEHRVLFDDGDSGLYAGADMRTREPVHYRPAW